jgi:hypothetical protein
MSGLIISSISILIMQKNPTPEVEPDEIKIPGTESKIMEAIEMVNESLVYDFLWGLLKYGPRRTSTDGCERAANYLFKQFEDMGLETRYQEWTKWVIYKYPKFYRSRNIEATLLGNGGLSEEILIVNAHYDTVKYAPGAIDDGTGVATVLTAAYVLSQFDFNRTIKFVTFSGEEVGLLGSRAYVNEIYEDDLDILVEFNLDGIGYATNPKAKYISLVPTEDAKWIVNEIKNVNEDYEIEFDIKDTNIIEPGGPRQFTSDFYDFVLHGYEAVDFRGLERYPYWHTPEDTIDKVNFGYLVNITKLVVASLAHMADIDVYYPQIRIIAPRRGRLYFEDRTVKNYRYEKTVVIDDYLICTEVKPGDAPIEKVEFYYDNKLVYTDTENPYQWRLNERSIKKHMVKVIVYDEIGRKARDEITFRFINLIKKK